MLAYCNILSSFILENKFSISLFFLSRKKYNLICDFLKSDDSQAKNPFLFRTAENGQNINDETRQRSTWNRFRKLKVELREDVSILFADIVGFTDMSSGKSAAELVELLNDLYGRFDDLAEMCKCEKIATLGDCYYCVSGCVTAQADHAR